MLTRSRIAQLTSLGLIATPALQAAEGGVSPYPYKLTEVFGLPITNSMVTTWVISLLLVLLVRLLVGGSPKLVPGRGQAVIEGAISWIKELIEPIVGKRMVGPTFPLIFGLFIFILIHNWSGMLPGVGTYGFIGGERELTYFQRPANSDLNMTLALALIVQIAWFYFVLNPKYAGAKVLIYDLFGNKADKAETPIAIYIFLFPVFFAVGLIEVISILFRNVSLSFRLYGNVFGGENLLTNMLGMGENLLTPFFAWIIAVPFYGLEILIGFVQAFVFALLTAVYIGLICNHGDDHGSAHAH
ncbi:MAG: F0F1 ATP synthase subunit A [Verrucomicrobiota bacterium]